MAKSGVVKNIKIKILRAREAISPVIHIDYSDKLREQLKCVQQGKNLQM